jgi:hypothetical protein
MKASLFILLFFLACVSSFASDVTLAVTVTPDPQGRWIMIKPRVAIHWSESETLILPYWSVTNMVPANLELRSADGTLQKEDIWTGPRAPTEMVEIQSGETKIFVGLDKHYSALKPGRYIAIVAVLGRTASRERIVCESMPVTVEITKRPNQAPEPTTTLVTPRADARVAPSAVVAHL